ncbi:unnamed protein product [Macrosiphum euphorbiae]|uniref:SAM domain-containing protein n=1 Tax=Macrosiphum euphorbiae TaxID=13131 RepID=A0AAV0Y3F7_9HEMI|nr:unnamed protein product [Macrosiphum euphorbiae]
MADEDVVDFLNAWDLSQYIQIFRENEIDIKTLGLLSDDMIRELVPIIGHRAKLKTNIDQWRLIIQGMTGSSEINFETELNQNSSEEHTNLKPTLTSTTLSAENHILINLDDLGVVQQSEQQSKEVPSSLQSPTNDDVHNLLKSTNEGKSLLASFGQSGLLDSVGRRRLCNLIINRELKDDAQKRVLSTRLQDLAYQITSVFHQERTPTYFIPYISYGPGLKRSAKGKLLDCLNNRRREYRKSGLIQTSRRSSTSSSSSSSFSLSKGLQHSVEEEDEELHSSVEEGLKWLQNSSDPWELVEKNWDITTNVRLKKLMSKNGQSIAKYMEEYPALKKPSGYLLILKDFQVSYPGKENKLYQNLIIYKNNIFELLRAKVNKTRDETVNNILNKYIKLYLEENEEISNIITLLSLSFLISVSSTRSKKSKIWRPSKIEVRDGFITHVRSDSEIQETITRKGSKLIEFGQTLQPFVIIVGHSLKEISSYLVVVDNTFYRLNSIIASVDCCFKIFLTLNAEYPVESSGIWYLIQRGLYNLKTPWDKNYTAVNAFMSDVGIRHTEDE